MMKTSNQTVQDDRYFSSTPVFSAISALGAACIERARDIRDVLARSCIWFGRGLIAPLAAWRRRQHEYDELMSLDDRILADIGITRGDIPYLVSNGAGHREAGNDNDAKAA